jgi:2-C-methyl-D-erythritol 4-phosphate cytidylyltransferase
LRGVVLLLAAGEGTRLDQAGPKAFVELAGKSLLRRAADSAAVADRVDSIVVAVSPGSEHRATSDLQGLSKPVSVVAGGSTRQASAAAALEAAPETEAFAVHDAARALCLPLLFDSALLALEDWEAVCPVVGVSDTIKEVSGNGVVATTLDRSKLVAVQTPQAVRADLYRRAHAEAAAAGFVGTDDVSLVERLGVDVHVIDGDASNLKITTKHDLLVAAAMLTR